MARLRQPAGSRSEIDRLRTRLAEAEETLSAIRSGEVDAIAVEGPNGRQIYTLQTADRPYQTFAESMSEGAASLASDGTITFCNRRLAEMVGHAQEKLLGAPAAILVPQDEKERLQQLLALGKQNVARSEIQFQRQDGTTLPVLVSVKPLASEQLPGICLIATDLSERKRAESELRDSEERYRSVVSAMAEAVVVQDASGKIIASNEPAARILRTPSSRLQGLTSNNFASIHEDGAPFEEDTYPPMVALRTGKPQTDVCMGLLRGDGAVTWVLMNSEPLFHHAEDRPHGVVTTFVDITDRKNTEAAIRAERQRFEDILDGLPVMICLLTADYRVAFANRAFEKQFGEAKGRRCYECCFGKTAPCAFCETFDVLKTKLPHNWEVAVSGRTIHAFDFPFVDVDGSPLVLEMDVDITEQRQAEERLRRASLYGRGLLEASLDPLVTISKAGKIMDTNHATELATGLLRDQLIGSDFSNYFTDPEKARQGYEKVFADGEIRDYPLAIRDQSGRVIDVLYNASVFRAGKGEVEGVFAAARDVTARKQAEMSLRESEQKFSTLADFVPQFVWMCTPDGLNFYFNQRWFDYTGLTPEESYGRRWNTPFHPDDNQAAWNAWNQAVATGETYRVESRLRAADGTYRWFLMRGMPQRDDAGKVVRWFGTCTDIQDFKNAEEEIRRLNRELEERVRNRTAELQTIFETAPIGLAISNDPEARHIHGNREIERMLGGSPGGELSKAAPDSPRYRLFSNGRELAARELPMQRAVCGEPVIGETMEVLRPDGTNITILGSAAPLFDEQRRTRGVVGTFVDITDQKRTERELRERTEELRQNQERLIESEQRVRKKLDVILSPEGDLGKLELADVLDIPALQCLFDDLQHVLAGVLAVLDLHGRVLAVSGWQSICQRFHRANAESCRNCTESDLQLAAGVPAGEFKVYKCRNNMWDAATPIMVGDQHLGNLYFGQIFFSDEPIDYEVFREQARRYGFAEKEYLAALEQVPRLDRDTVKATMVFLAKLAQVLSKLNYSGIKLARSSAQLGRANAELEAANKELEAFSYSVSHDLRAPLRHISGFSKILSEEFGPQLPEEAQHHLERIQQGTRRMGQLVDDLLNLSRVGRRELQRQVTSLENILRQVLSDLQPECEGREVQWNIDPLPFVECDGALLKQVFQNLLSNSLKFTRPRKQAVIEVGCKKEEGVPVIFVRDNGVGFNLKYASKLFGVFQRMHRAEDFEGTGVGLATVQRIVQKHEGCVWAEAEVDKGAAFYFTLAPLHKTHQESAPEEEMTHELVGH